MINIQLYKCKIISSKLKSIIDFRLDYGFNIFKEGDHQWICIHNYISAN